ncbi:hypothetical protein SUNI508_10905 [Seiridium unicorne]|uniref:Uncharacterized protein n=1 Tax=Seiridium unicorne TaxID=138068 RepID=A0ABR2UJJ2_9PEZI
MFSFTTHRGTDLSCIQRLLENPDLLKHALLAGATLGRPHLHALFVVKALGNIFLESGVDALELLLGELVHGGIGVLGQGNNLTGDMVGLTERHALADKVVCDICGQHEGIKSSLHLLL